MRHETERDWLEGRDARTQHEREMEFHAEVTCPVCGGAGIVDTSPPGVEERP